MDSMKTSSSLPELSEKQLIPHSKSSASFSSGYSSFHSNTTPPSVFEPKNMPPNTSSQNGYLSSPQVNQQGDYVLSDVELSKPEYDSYRSMPNSSYYVVQGVIVLGNLTTKIHLTVHPRKPSSSPAYLSPKNMLVSDTCPDRIPTVEKFEVSQAEPVS